MKKIMQYSILILIAGCIGFTSCKKENPATSVVTPLPPTSNQQLISLGTLSIPREYVCAATAGTKILFAGGTTEAYPYIPSSRVDIYDTVTQSWSMAELSIPRVALVATTVDNKIYFTDGFINGSSRVDIYDASTNSWSTAELNTARAGLVSGSTGSKAVFAGGYTPFGDRIDILDASTNTWSTATLNEPRAEISSASFGNKIYFSGGIKEDVTISNKVDIYDAASNGWSTIVMTEPRLYHVSIAADNKIFWAGGCSSFDSDGELIANNTVEVYNVNTGGRVHHQLTRNPFYTAVISNTILFFSAFYGTSLSIDVYDINTQTWSIRDISFSVPAAIGWPRSIIGSGNKIFLAEGLNGSNPSKVWKLEF